MSEACNLYRTHPLVRDGRSQADRKDVRALSPDYARPDDRGDKQWLSHLYEFAKAVVFHDQGGPQGNWQDFFRTGASAQAAIIAGFNADQLQADFEDAQQRFADGLNKGDFGPLLDFLFETALTVGQWHASLSSDREFVDGEELVNESPLKRTIGNLIFSNLRAALLRLAAAANSVGDFQAASFDLAYQTETDEQKTDALLKKIEAARYKIPVFSAEMLLLWGLEDASRLSARDGDLQALAAKPAEFLAAATDKLAEVFGVFENAIRRIVAAAEGIDILQPTQMHEPHLGLIYAFLKLFGYVQKDLNALPKRRLDFYFRQVLKLQPLPFTPDAAHLVFELNKPFTGAKIEKGAVVKDGKDALKAEIGYKTVEELIVSEAQIVSLRSLHLDLPSDRPPKRRSETLTAAPAANSADGAGAPFSPDAAASWAPLGTPAAPAARVGLLLASPALRLAEGARTITAHIKTKTAPTDAGDPWASYTPKKEALEKLTGDGVHFALPTPLVQTSDASAKAVLKALENALGINNPSGLSTDFIALFDKTGSGEQSEYFLTDRAIAKLTAARIDYTPPAERLIIRKSASKNFLAALSKALKIQPPQTLDASVVDTMFDKNLIPYFGDELATYVPTKKAIAKLQTAGINFVMPAAPVFIRETDEEKILAALIRAMKIQDGSALKTDFIALFDKTGLFDVQLSGAKGWFRPSKVDFFTVKDDNNSADDPTFPTRELKMVITLGPGEDAVVPADPAILKADYGVAEPLLRMELNHDILDGAGESFYRRLTYTKIETADLGVSVQGVTKNLLLQNDFGLLDAKKPFLPFGPQPQVGSSFYVGSDEIFRKKISALTFTVNWQGVPIDLFKYYSAYTDYINPKPVDFHDNTYWKFDAALLENGRFEKVADHTPLYQCPLQNPVSYSFTYSLQNPRAERQVLQPFSLAESRDGFLVWTLNQDFFHQNYPTAAAEISKLIAQAKKDNKPAPDMPNPPFTPTAAAFSVDYEAADDFNTGLQAWHLHPFEETSRTELTPHGGYGLAPAYVVKTEKPTPQPVEGALLIGLKGAQGGENLNLLFQLNEASADSYLEKANIYWSILVGNEWKPLADGKNILSDDTEGFIRSGVVSLSLPFGLAAAEPPTLLPPALTWLRAATDANAAAACQAAGVHTQAVKVVFDNQNNDLARLDAPMAANSIKKMDAPMAEIKGASQPYDSFGGRAPESDDAFYARASERLRHKGRAVTLFDYEHIVLSAFPELYKVKCLTHSFADRRDAGAQDKLWAPGHVAVVVVPDWSSRPFSERLEPRASRKMLEDVTAYLKTRTSRFVRAEAMNPIFEKIHTSCLVKFQKGKSAEYFRRQLSVDLQRFFAPWAFDGAAQPEFSGEIYRSAIMGFIEQRDYVDYVETLLIWKDGDTEADKAANIKLGASTARGILAAGEQLIEAIV